MIGGDGSGDDVMDPNHIIYFLEPYIARVSITRAMSLAIAVTDGLVSEHLVCCDTTSINPATVNLLLEQVYYMTFRSPKFGVSQSASAQAAAVRAVAQDDVLAAESLDEEEVPQALIDMTARAADDTGRMVRSHPTSGLTPVKKRRRTAMADLADRFERESEELKKRYEDHDAQVSKRFGTTDISRYPRSDRDHLERLYNASGRRAQLAESLRRDVRDLDHEYPEVPAATAAAADLDHTDTLPLDN